MKLRSPVSVILLVAALFIAGCGFVGSPGPQNFDPGFWLGIWHGLLAPWSVLARFFIDVGMYELPNTGIGYDTGFLLGVTFSLPIGWLAALIALGFHLLY